MTPNQKYNIQSITYALFFNVSPSLKYYDFNNFNSSGTYTLRPV